MDSFREKIQAHLEEQGLEACAIALGDIAMDMYMASEEIDDKDEPIYYFDADKEVSGADLVAAVGETLIGTEMLSKELQAELAQDKPKEED